MPKVYISREQRQKAHLAAWLYGNMKTCHVTQEQLAERIGVSQQGLSKKIKEQRFTYSDLLVIFDTFKPDSDEMYRLFGLRKPTGSE